ncbi:MAG: sigma-70 family RNA polymerase sigma factor [Roseinatronobacter sp.]|uniref:RNA polymerase sigma-70 factor (ECF subfamily) n=1 Tax=Roseinatronobacter monicus TaxID=393481 RepID=A0A543KA24_9RHOB|nr:RNA polymerase sigma-70 factor (ECF subfamily) [Roseinatronobacter monicus]TVQ02681.1 MAG: sigma-70 family RNA polymerase sigma factor [Roseinatronobacter sp.]
MFDFAHPSHTARQAGLAVDMLLSEREGTRRGKRQSAVNAQNGAKWVVLLEKVAAEQSTDAFTELFEHFAPRVKGFLMKSGADHALAEECAQDVMVTVWKKAAQFDPARASVATWIFTIARNRRIDMMRKDRRPEPEELTWGPEAEPDQLDVMTLQQESELLISAIANLPEKQRVMIERAYFGDLTHSEIADETGLPLGTIKSRIRLALERLRHSLS